MIRDHVREYDYTKKWIAAGVAITVMVTNSKSAINCLENKMSQC